MSQSEINNLKAALKKLLSQCVDKPETRYMGGDIQRVLDNIKYMEMHDEFNDAPYLSTEEL